MGLKDNAKALIDANVYANGQEQITGQGLNATLKGMVDILPTTDEILTGINGTATESNAPNMGTGFFRYIVTEPITTGSAWGIAVTQAELDDNWVFFNVTDGVITKDSKPQQGGKSAYQLAVEAGYGGTEIEWLESLNGADGSVPIVQSVGQSTTDVMSQKSVTDEFEKQKLIYSERGKNLFDKSKVNNTGYLKTSDGYTITPDANLWHSPEFIPIEPSTSYINNKSGNYHLFYTADKTFITALSTPAFTTPANAAFLRVDFIASGIDTLQIEKGSVSTPYEPFKMVFKTGFINNKSITRAKLADDAVKVLASDIDDYSLTVNKMTFFDPSLNLFDKSKIQQGYYSTSNGVSFVSDTILLSIPDFIVVKPSTQYVSSHKNAYILCYRADKSFITSTYVTTDGQVISTPADCAFVRINVRATDVNTYQFEEGSVKTSFVPFDPTLSLAKIGLDVITVSKSGKGNYTTIQAAVTAANEGATILVMPGVYEEWVVCGAKTVHIVAVSKQNTLLWNDTGEYHKTPIWINKGSLVNFNVKLAFNPNKDYSALGEFDTGYGVHYDVHNANGSLLIDNCDIISDFNSALGCGARENSTLIIRNSRVIATNASGKYPGADGFNYHGGADGTTARIVFDNSLFKGYNKDVKLLNSAVPNTIHVEAYRNIAKKVEIGGTSIYVKDSYNFGNQSTLLNAP